jgi:hypothetical protein
MINFCDKHKLGTYDRSIYCTRGLIIIMRVENSFMCRQNVYKVSKQIQ